MTETARTKGKVTISLHEDGTVTIDREDLSSPEATAMILTAYRMEMTQINRRCLDTLDREDAERVDADHG